MYMTRKNIWSLSLLQVVHHPTIMAAYCEGRKWQVTGDGELRSKFTGPSIQLNPVGMMHLTFCDGDEYTWHKVCCATGILHVQSTLWVNFDVIKVRGKAWAMLSKTRWIQTLNVGWFWKELVCLPSFVVNAIPCLCGGSLYIDQENSMCHFSCYSQSAQHVQCRPDLCFVSQVTTSINNIIVGKLNIDHGGIMNVRNITHGQSAKMKFKQQGILQFRGEIHVVSLRLWFVCLQIWQVLSQA